MTDQQITGGFGHEMRNALAGAKMLLGTALGPQGGQSLAAQDSEAMREALNLVRDRAPVSANRAGLVALLTNTKRNEQQIDEILREVDGALARAIAMTQTIMDYARLGREQPGSATVLLRPLVEAIVAESKRELAAHGIEAEIAIDPKLALTAKETHVYSIVKNLVLNAKDALIDQEALDGRRIRISAEEEADRRVLRVEDTGSGISPENRAKIFDPFFSTKPRTGTGLGLGMVKRLVSLYEGTIDVESEVLRGTTFVITLPRRERIDPKAPAVP
jgi:histidine kinase